MATKKEILEELGRLAEKEPERKIVCLDNEGVEVSINSVELDDWGEPWRYILTGDEDEKEEMTVARLMECLSEVDPDSPDPEGEESEIFVRLNEDGCPRYLDDSSGSIFFEHTVGGEKVIAFRCGDDAEVDDDFFDDVC